ncbi:hypothetical protein AB6806_10970 [Bosea sp. RCC_152_1]
MESTEQEYAQRSRQAQRQGLFYLAILIVSVLVGLMLKHAAP